MLRGRFLSAISLLILLTAIYCSGQDAASDIRKALQNEYQGKVLIIRGFYSGAKLQYDSQANIVDGATRGSWSSDGLVQLNDISLDQQKLHISGHRVITLFDSKDDIFKDRLTHEQIDIDIQVDPTWKELPAFENVLGRVFTRDRNYFTTEAADYWGHWLSGPIVQVRDWEWKCTGEEKNPVRTTAYRVGGGISAPRAIIAADADYSAIARKVNLRGSSLLFAILNERGEVTEIRIVRPLGAGLDERAVEAVRKWKFAPATKDGKPVPIKINIEVNFR